MSHGGDHDFIDEKADYDRRSAQKYIVDEAHHDGEPRRFPVFRHISPGQDADWRANRNRQSSQHQTAYDGVEQAAVGSGRRRHLREYAQRQAAQSFVNQRSQDQYEPPKPQHCGADRQYDDDRVTQTAPAVTIHAHPTRFSSRDSKKRAAANTMNVIANRISPNAISDEV